MTSSICKSGNGVCGTKSYDCSLDKFAAKPAACNGCPCEPKYLVATKIDCNGCTKSDLCIAPSKCIIKDETCKKLFCELKESIIFHKLHLALKGITDVATYDAFLAVIVQIASRVTDGRIIVTLPDGTLVLDTEGSANTFADFQAGTVGENHNSRVAVLCAQKEACGTGYERKLSSTTDRIEKYVAIRLGKYLDSEGTIRFSVPSPDPLVI